MRGLCAKLSCPRCAIRVRRSAHRREVLYADWPAFDIVAQSMGGLVAVRVRKGHAGYKAGQELATLSGTLAALGGLCDSPARRSVRDNFLTSRVYTRFSRCARWSLQLLRASESSAEPEGQGTAVLCPFDLFRRATAHK